MSVGNRARHLATAAGLRARLSAADLARAARAGLAAVGVPIRKEFLVLGCAEGEDASGLFSEMAAVIGALEHYEAWSGIYAGLQVNFGAKGLYHDPNHGDNWWEYYFEPVCLGSAAHAATSAVAPLQHDAFAYRVERTMSRSAAAALLARHVRVKAEVSDAVERFVRETFTGARVVGIHYRGTDKSEDAAAVSYDMMTTAMREALQVEGPDRCLLFVATDEQSFLDRTRRLFPDRVRFREMPRSADGRPIHKTRGTGFTKGLDAVMDCLLLARCQRLIRTTSNLSLFSTFFNPDLPVTLLERPK